MYTIAIDGCSDSSGAVWGICMLAGVNHELEKVKRLYPMLLKSTLVQPITEDQLTPVYLIFDGTIRIRSDKTIKL